MTAIYKKELKGYLTSMIGYVFIFFILLLEGIYFTAYNIQGAYPVFGITLNAITFVFLILVPILTMKVIAEERKQKTDQMLLTAPVSVTQIVVGKYLALISVYMIPIIVIC
ncbi:ABC transporter permease, partial [Frisingicoccus sp.]|uniref:ABC transporter permease n=1 Tax=Frisingicoccus sp. TaxID=1918627 RepID=UPI002A7EF842